MIPATGQYPRRVTVHVLSADGRPPVGRRVEFTDDLVAVARELAPGVGLRPHAVRTELAVLHGGDVRMHIDRVIFAPATSSGADDVASSLASDAFLPAAADLEEDDVVPTGHVLRRFAAYGLVTDPAGRVLLSRIAPGFPGAGTWHLPGGGTDHGEAPQDALHREIREETGQDAVVTSVLSVRHHHAVGQIGPEGVDTEISAVWVVLRAHVARPTTARVLEVNGSTERSAWFTAEEIPTLELSLTATTVLGDVPET
ncbi:NUDIX domain-containing protein [Spiractinospora alimapuensis]|uniref:NUDIX hydrolase n=1 Tax=Spiractinospora alimapuensis TaxID=2820884 RepID=UPI001F29B136|nr:NUDIX domain-containing protein [Spiractinospora alimapuensis]QVQ52919.1 NUDIX domain-containing protein [Spiractinospora alimapuensis]